MYKFPIRSIFWAVLIAGVWVLGSGQDVMAHMGHVGELAGHGHLLGLGLTGAAVVLAGYLVTKGAKNEEADDAASVSGEGDEEHAAEKSNA